MSGEPRRVHLTAVIITVAAVVTIGVFSFARTPSEDDATKPDPAVLDLPRIPWEGGPAYWSHFDDASDWTDPAFFPVSVWYAGISSAEEVAWDKAHGINTYLGMWEGTPFSLFEDNDVYWIGGELNETFDADSPHWPGVVLDDEVDGRFTPEDGFAHLAALSRDAEGSGKFRYANFTQLVIGPDLDVEVQEQYVNGFTDVVSIDMYWYSIPFCDWQPYRGEDYAVSVPEDTCRTASSYGRAMRALTIRDGVDGLVQPRWQFIENLNGLSGHDHLTYISPGQLKGAAMSSIISEARGLVWFNQSFTGPCQSTNVVRTAQMEGDAWCGAEQVAAMGEVNNFVHDLAPMINTQSYVWDFGDGLDTMLKVHDGDAYIFAMTDGETGERGFSLPPGISATTAEVVGEGRSVEVAADRFVDHFENEYDYHVYRITL